MSQQNSICSEGWNSNSKKTWAITSTKNKFYMIRIHKAHELIECTFSWGGGKSTANRIWSKTICTGSAGKAEDYDMDPCHRN